MYCIECIVLNVWYFLEKKLNRELCFHFMLSNKGISHSHYSKTSVNVIPSKL